MRRAGHAPLFLSLVRNMTSSASQPLAYRLGRPLAWAVLVVWMLLFITGFLAVASPGFAAFINANTPAVEFLATITALGLFVVWIAAALLLGEAPIPYASKKRWIIALVLCNLFAGMVFVLWRYPRSLEEQRGAA